jgi:hypothetical protein
VPVAALLRQLERPSHRSQTDKQTNVGSLLDQSVGERKGVHFTTSKTPTS